MSVRTIFILAMWAALVAGVGASLWAAGLRANELNFKRIEAAYSLASIDLNQAIDLDQAIDPTPLTGGF